MRLPTLYEGELHCELPYILRNTCRERWFNTDLPPVPDKHEVFHAFQPMQVTNTMYNKPRWAWMDCDPVAILLNKYVVSSCQTLDCSVGYNTGNMNYVYCPFMASVFVGKQNPATAKPVLSESPKTGESCVTSEGEILHHRPHIAVANVFLLVSNGKPFMVLQRLYDSSNESQVMREYFKQECQRIGIGCGFTSSWGHSYSHDSTYHANGYSPTFSISYAFDMYGTNGGDNGLRFRTKDDSAQFTMPFGSIFNARESFSIPNVRESSLTETQFCCQCGDRFDGTEEGMLHNARWYCEDCTFMCERCNDTFPGHVAESFDDGAYCGTCINQVSVTCCDCSTRVDTNHAYSDDYGDSYCESCYCERYTSCENCGSECGSDETVPVTRRSIHYTDVYMEAWCKYCAESRTVSCASCGDYTFVFHLIGRSTWEPEGDFTCHNCPESTLLPGQYNPTQLLFPANETEVNQTNMVM